MTRRRIVIAAVAALMATATWAQGAAEHVGRLVAEKDCFSLVRVLDTVPRDSLDPLLRDVANVMTCNYFNRNDDACRLARRLISRRQQQLGLDNTFGIASLIPLNLARQGRYAQAADMAESLHAQAVDAGAPQAMADGLRSLGSYYRVLADVGDICRQLHAGGRDLSVSFFYDRRAQAGSEGAFLAMNGHVNGVATYVGLDTGASLNVISSADADRMRLIRLNYYIDVRGAGRRRGQLAIADTLRIGRDMAWRNVPFVVVDMATGDSIADRAVSRGMPVMVGMPLMERLGEVSIDFVSQRITVPSRPTPCPYKFPNMMRGDDDQLTLLVGSDGGETLRMNLDTGSYNTTLTPRWLAAHPSAADTAQPDSVSYGAVGGTVRLRALRLPRLDIAIGPARATISGAMALSGAATDGTEAATGIPSLRTSTDGTIGLAALRHFASVTISLRGMFVTAKARTGGGG